MIDLFESTGSIHEDVETFKDYLQDNFRAYKAIKTKERELMYLVHCNDNTTNYLGYNGRIYVLSQKGIIGLLEYEVVKDPGILTIKDIQYKDPKFYGVGIGSAIIKFLQEYAIEQQIILIKGYLEPYDIEHNKDRLINFYSKHDFNVDFYHREVKKIIETNMYIGKPKN